MSSWTSPPFQSLPASSHPSFRWAGSRLVDEEQYRVEVWETRDGCWRISIEGIEAYSALRAQRRLERKVAWQTRQDADDEWSSHVQSLVGEP